MKKRMNREKSLVEYTPASRWEEAFPLGNGALGAMVHGRVTREVFELNEESVWDGAARDRINPDARGNLDEIRRLLREGRPEDAEELALYSLAGTPENENCYQSPGFFSLNFQPRLAGGGVNPPDESDVTDYYRFLDLENALAETGYRRRGISYKREHFISAPAGLFVTRLGCSEPGKLSFTGRFGRKDYIEKSFRTGSDTLIMTGSGHGADAIRFACGAKVLCGTGEIRCLGDHVIVEEAEEALLLIGCVTSFRSRDPERDILERLDRGAALGWPDLKKGHTEDYRRYFDRMDLSLTEEKAPEEANAPIATSQRLRNLENEASDRALYSLYFHFGRYLLISSSRPGTLPANLQGIWNPHSRPPWGSKYTININTQMNYWPAEICGLGDCHSALFDHIEKMIPSGRRTAEKMYGCRGFAAHHNTDIWGDCAPQDHWMPATFWTLGAAWLCLHILDHYAFTRDRGFLDRYYPVIQECILFFEDFLVENAKGQLVTSPTVSPENTYILESGRRGRMCEGSSMDSQILRELFLGAADWALLKEDEKASEKYREMESRLPPIATGRDGRIQEWPEEYGEAEPGHRHISHLFALYPGHQIRPSDTPELCEASRKTLLRRLEGGGGHTGWSRAWILNFWARLEKKEEAGENLRLLLTRSTLPNLFCDHPPFQIDGNFGGTAGIMELLIQSGEKNISILPALPSDWPEGFMRGARLRTGLIADLKWHGGRLDSLCLHPAAGRVGWDGRIRLRYQGIQIERTLPEDGTAMKINWNDFCNERQEEENGRGSD